jgi:hypothetical protein
LWLQVPGADQKRKFKLRALAKTLMFLPKHCLQLNPQNEATAAASLSMEVEHSGLLHPFEFSLLIFLLPRHKMQQNLPTHLVVMMKL